MIELLLRPLRWILMLIDDFVKYHVGEVLKYGVRIVVTGTIIILFVFFAFGQEINYIIFFLIYFFTHLIINYLLFLELW